MHQWRQNQPNIIKKSGLKEIRQTFKERGLKNVVTLMNKTAWQHELVSNFITTSCALFIMSI